MRPRHIILAAAWTLSAFAAPSARADELRVGFFAEIRELVAAAAFDEAEARLEAEFLGSTTEALSSRLAMLDVLAEVQDRAGKHGDRGDTLFNKAALMAREFGADYPDLSEVYLASGRAYLAAGAFDRAEAALTAALRIDRQYLDCAGPALAALFQLLAEARDGAGDAAGAEAARALAGDPLARCEAARGSRSVAEAVPGEDGAFARVEIFYGTDRAPSGSPRPNAHYGWARGDGIDYGRAIVTIPRGHKPGQVESPSMLRFEWEENPALHIVVAEVEQLAEDRFFQMVGATLRAGGSDEVFVFVHGFNTSFSDGAKRTAQIAYDLNFEGAPILYSWPSRGSTSGYMADAATVQVSARRLTWFLEDVVNRSGAGNVHLIAHSMGSRALTVALELFALRHAGEPPVFGQVIFAAPDVDAQLFAMQTATMQTVARRVTLYTSSFDLALSASRALHGDAPRAGQGGEVPVVSVGLDTVDMSNLGGDLLRHNYFASQTSALSDILWLFWRNPPPPGRCGMDEAELAEGIYWIYEAEACDGQLLLPAITLARRHGDGALQEVDRMIAEAEAGGQTAGRSSLDELVSLRAALSGLLAQ